MTTTITPAELAAALKHDSERAIEFAASLLRLCHCEREVAALMQAAHESDTEWARAERAGLVQPVVNITDRRIEATYACGHLTAVWVPEHVLAMDGFDTGEYLEQTATCLCPDCARQDAETLPF